MSSLDESSEESEPRYGCWTVFYLQLLHLHLKPHSSVVRVSTQIVWVINHGPRRSSLFLPIESRPFPDDTSRLRPVEFLNPSGVLVVPTFLHHIVFLLSVSGVVLGDVYRKVSQNRRPLCPCAVSSNTGPGLFWLTLVYRLRVPDTFLFVGGVVCKSLSVTTFHDDSYPTLYLMSLHPLPGPS